MRATDVHAAVEEIADGWRRARAERQLRRHLEQQDFDALAKAGFLLLPVPVSAGGLWEEQRASLRPICEVLRTMARGDPSVALVSSMHPAVIAFWLTSPDPGQSEWERQRASVFASAAAGEQWGTITSEPGSGGDIFKTKTIATPDADVAAFITGHSYRLSGDKHFGSGSGIADRMITSGLPAGEAEPTIFVLDVRNRPWDGSAGLTLIAEWDGMGMAATQSHAMRFEGIDAVRIAWPGALSDLTFAAGPMISSLFTSVVLGVLDEAIATARSQLGPKAQDLRAYERVEWARAEQDHWVAVQAYEGALRAAEGDDAAEAVRATLRAKEAVADIAEATLLRLTRVLGGGTFSARSPFAHWFEDVRALGFLRPPWGLAYDNLFLTSGL